MKVESNIRVGQLVKIKNQQVLNPNALYLVVSKHRGNCELIPVNNKTNGESRRYWTEQGLSVYA
jgi:hypothetical protein